MQAQRYSTDTALFMLAYAPDAEPSTGGSGPGEKIFRPPPPSKDGRAKNV